MLSYTSRDAANVVHCFLFLIRVVSGTFDDTVPVNKMSIELRAVDTGEFCLTAHGQAAGAAHTGAVEHDRVHGNDRPDPVFLCGVTDTLHHAGRPNAHDFVIYVSGVKERLHLRYVEARFAIGTVIGRDVEIGHARAHFVFQDHDILRTETGNHIHFDTEIMHTFCHRVRDRVAHAAADNTHAPETFHVGRTTERTDKIRDVIARFHQVEHTGGLPDRLHHDRDGALFGIGRSDRDRDAFTKFVETENDELTGLDIDLIKANTNVMQGSNETMVQLLDYVKSHNMNTDEAYQVLDSAIDIQNYIEYMAVEMYTGNTDTLNVKRYRNPKADGKWRWVLFDLDWAFTTDTNSPQRWQTPGGMGNQNHTDNSLFIACMKNATFADRFLTYLGEKMATTYSTENITRLAEEFYNAIAPIMPEHYARWDWSESAHKAAIKDFLKYAQQRPGRMLQFIKYNKYLPLTKEQMEHYFGDAMALVGVSYGDIEKP